MPGLVAMGAAHLSERSLGFRWPLPGLRQAGVPLLGWYSPDAQRCRAGADYVGIEAYDRLDAALAAPASGWLILVPRSQAAGVIPPGDAPLIASAATAAGWRWSGAAAGSRSACLCVVRHAPWVADIRQLAATRPAWHGLAALDRPRLVLEHQLGAAEARRGGGSAFAAVDPWQQDELDDPRALALLVGVPYLDALSEALGELTLESVALSPGRARLRGVSAEVLVELRLVLGDGPAARAWGWRDGERAVSGTLDPGPIPLAPTAVTAWLDGDRAALPTLETVGPWLDAILAAI